MKKIYAVGMALTVGLSAMATQKATTSVVESKASTDMTYRTYEKATVESAASGKAVTSINDLLGLYRWSSEGHLNAAGKQGPMQSAVMFEENNSNSVLISSFPWAGKMTEMAVNIDTKVVVINGDQYVGDNGVGGDPVYIYVYETTVNSENQYERKRVNNIKGTVMDNGDVSFPENYWIGATDQGAGDGNSFYYLQGNNQFKKLPFATPENLEGYEKIGDGVFTDGWFNPLLALNNVPKIENVSVPVWRNKTNGKELLVENPYADAKWSDVKLRVGDGKGYLIFNVELEELVTVTPLVESGMVTDDSENADGSVLGHYYLENEEGLRAWGGEDKLDLLDEYVMGELPCSNVEGNQVTFLNLFFGVDEAPAGQYWWNADTATRIATLVLPDGWRVGDGGVNGITVDNEVAPRYYNLQGVEIAAPVKGQLTIKKEGNKAVKFIAR